MTNTDDSIAIRPRILVVDDIPANLKVVETILDHFDADLCLVGSGEEALQILMEDDEFALVILDVHMPGMSGYELAKLIRDRKQTRYLPIVFLSAVFNSDESIFEGYQSGAVDFLTKPFNPDVFRAKISVFLDLFMLRKNSVDYVQKLADSRAMALREVLIKQQFLNRIYENLYDGLLVLDKHLKVNQSNPRALEITGLADVEIQYKPIADLLGEDISGLLAQNINFKNKEIFLKKANGSRLLLSVSCSVLHNEHGMVDCVLVVLTDISELSVLKERERFRGEVERQDRLASLGKLAGGISHDFNNMMGMIMGYVEILKATIEDNRAQKTFNSILQVLDRSVGTISKLSSLGSNAIDRLECFCMATLLTNEYKYLMSSFTGVKLSLLPIHDDTAWWEINRLSRKCYLIFVRMRRTMRFLIVKMDTFS